MTNTILGLMVSYFGRDVKRINHTFKVLCFAQLIAEKEHCNRELYEIISYSAILHDIGIPESERKYNSNAGKYQEIEGPIVAKKLLMDVEIPNEMKERVYYLIGNHHSYEKIHEIDFQILVEADFMVNIFEEEMHKESIRSIKEKIFKTKTGMELLEKLYL